jgi:hypothetical protein
MTPTIWSFATVKSISWITKSDCETVIVPRGTMTVSRSGDVAFHASVSGSEFLAGVVVNGRFGSDTYGAYSRFSNPLFYQKRLHRLSSFGGESHQVFCFPMLSVWPSILICIPGDLARVMNNRSSSGKDSSRMIAVDLFEEYGTQLYSGIHTHQIHI